MTGRATRQTDRLGPDHGEEIFLDQARSERRLPRFSTIAYRDGGTVRVGGRPWRVPGTLATRAIVAMCQAQGGVVSELGGPLTVRGMTCAAA
jgi:hypothetical protein